MELFIGMIMAGIIYISYRKYTKGKIIVYIFTKDRTLFKKAVKPGSLREIQVADRTYVYNEECVIYTTHFMLKEIKPALLYHEDNPNPVNPYTGQIESVVTSTELSKMMNDATVRDFISAQSAFQPKQIVGIVVVMALLQAILIIGAMIVLNSEGGLSGLAEGQALNP